MIEEVRMLTFNFQRYRTLGGNNVFTGMSLSKQFHDVVAPISLRLFCSEYRASHKIIGETFIRRVMKINQDSRG